MSLGSHTLSACRSRPVKTDCVCSQRGHRASYLNDNLDGTLTIVKRLTSTSVRIGARVVSQHAPAKLEKLAKPRLASPVRRIAAAKAEVLAKQDREKNKTQKNKDRRRLEAAARLRNKPGRNLAKTTSATTSSTKSTPSAPVPTKELLSSASGREYTKYLNGDLNYGTLFPDGYKLSSYPKMPWVCPVRDCQRVLPAIVNLGSHFTRKHRHTLFNDNGDGTLSKVGTHPQMRAFVVSTIKRPASEMEPLAKQIPPGYQPRGAEPVTTPPSTQTTVTPVFPSATRPVANGMDLMISPLPGPHDFAKPLPVDKQATWDYIQPFLARSLRKPDPPSSGYPSLYLACPQVRNLKLNERRKKAAPNGELFGMSTAAALIQLSGDYVPTPCDHCKSGRGLFEGCVITSSKGNADMSVAYAKCANCVERRNNDKCSLLPIFRPRFAELFPNFNYDTTYRYARSGNFGYVEHAVSLGLQRLTSQNADVVRRESGAAKTVVEKTNAGGGGGGSSGNLRGGAGPTASGGGGGGGGSSNKDPDPASSDNEPLARGALRRGGSSLTPRRQASFQHEHEHEHENDEVTPDTHNLRSSGRNADKDGSMVPLAQPKRTTSSSMALTRTHTTDSDTALVFAGNVQPGPESLEMEDWEVAPGRVQTKTHENIAFSNAYLTSNQMVPIDHNMSYRVEVVRPGQSVSFDSEGQAMRMCTLASGKLRVAVGDDRFTMGPHGMFKVKPGTSFLVENRLYIDAYLHITALHNAV